MSIPRVAIVGSITAAIWLVIAAVVATSDTQRFPTYDVIIEVAALAAIGLATSAMVQRPSGSNWARAWHRALESVGQKPLRVYDCRHAAATTWLRAGMPLAETARRLGHSVETLVSTYVGALDDEEHIANQRVDTILG